MREVVVNSLQLKLISLSFVEVLRDESEAAAPSTKAQVGEMAEQPGQVSTFSKRKLNGLQIFQHLRDHGIL
jgi:hypothetical protein